MAKKKKTAKKDFPVAVDLRTPEQIAEWEANEAAMRADADLHAQKRQETKKKQMAAYARYINNIT